MASVYRRSGKFGAGVVAELRSDHRSAIPVPRLHVRTRLEAPDGDWGPPTRRTIPAHLVIEVSAGVSGLRSAGARYDVSTTAVGAGGDLRSVGGSTSRTAMRPFPHTG